MDAEAALIEALQRSAQPLKRSVRQGQTLASSLAPHGRNGDELIAHLTPDQMAILKALGGSGTTNPTTGLPEFFGADANSEVGDSSESTGGDTSGNADPGGPDGQAGESPGDANISGAPSNPDPAPTGSEGPGGNSGQGPIGQSISRSVSQAMSGVVPSLSELTEADVIGKVAMGITPGSTIASLAAHALGNTIGVGINRAAGLPDDANSGPPDPAANGVGEADGGGGEGQQQNTNSDTQVAAAAPRVNQFAEDLNEYDFHTDLDFITKIINGQATGTDAPWIAPTRNAAGHSRFSQAIVNSVFG